MFRHFTHSILAISALLMGGTSQAKDITIPYTGRFVEANAKPVDGPVDVVVEFFAKEAGGESLASPQNFPAVALDDGVFQLNISLSSAEFHKMIPSVDSPLWLQVTDATNGAVYPRQAMATSAFALKVPVDGTTISWNSDGQLELNKNAVVNKVGGQTLVTSGATAGQVLAWDVGSKTWKPTSVSAATSSIANDGISGDKIDSGTISNFASTGIDDNATSNAMTISSSGKIGIGTTNPLTPLDIRANDPDIRLDFSATPSANSAEIHFSDQGIEKSTIGFQRISEELIIGADQDNNGVGGFSLYVGPSPKLTVVNSGNVGIGTTAPVGVLDARGSSAIYQYRTDAGTGLRNGLVLARGDGSGNNMILNTDSDVANDASALVVSSVYDEIARFTKTGKVGIGTTDPQSILHLSKTDDSPQILVVNKDSSVPHYPGMVVTNYSGATPNTGHPVVQMRSSGGTEAVPTAIAAHQGLAVIDAAGYDGNDFIQSGRISIGSEAAFSPGNNPTYISFLTGSGGTYSEHVRINSAGNVGIGIKDPPNPLSVSPMRYSTGIASQAGTTVTGSSTTWTSDMVGSELVFNNEVSAGTITAFVSPTSLTVSTSQTVSLQNYSIHYAGMNVTSSGNVGIGTITPQAALEVNGAVRLNTVETKPACTAATRGSLYVEQGGLTFADKIYVCLKSNTETYSWVVSASG